MNISTATPFLIRALSAHAQAHTQTEGIRMLKKTIIYATDPRRFGRLEWRLEVWDAEDGKQIVPTWRTLSNARWNLPAEHAGEWPKGLFQLCADHVSELAAAVEGRK